MKLVVVAVRDSKASVFCNIGLVTTLGVAVRTFNEQINSGQGAMSKHYGDFDLYELATFDDATGVFDSYPPKPVVTGVSMKEQAPAVAGQLPLNGVSRLEG